MVILITTLCCVPLRANPETTYVEQDAAHAKPIKQLVISGVFPTDLHSFNYSKNSFDVSFYIWWLTKDKRYRPDKIVEIINAFSYSHRITSHIKYEDLYKVAIRYYATIYHKWDMTHFPFDRQQLQVHLEDGFADIESVRFIPDISHSNIPVDFRLDGWVLDDFSLIEIPHRYNTNLGDPTIDESTYSRLTLTFEIKRKGLRNFFNYFIGFFVAIFLSSLTYFIKPTELNPKMALILAATFATIGNKYILDGMLPIFDKISLADTIQFGSIAYVFIMASVIVLVDYLSRQEKAALGRIINFWVLIASLIIYCSLIGLRVYFAVTS